MWKRIVHRAVQTNKSVLEMNKCLEHQLSRSDNGHIVTAVLGWYIFRFSYSLVDHFLVYLILQFPELVFVVDIGSVAFSHCVSVWVFLAFASLLLLGLLAYFRVCWALEWLISNKTETSAMCLVYGTCSDYKIFFKFCLDLLQNCGEIYLPNF